jgi:hypothetical protein
VSAPREQWPTTQGLVYSVNWFEPTYDNEGYPHYTVVYSYRIGTERYVGQFDDYHLMTDAYLRKDDSILIHYCPEQPEKSYYADAQSANKKGLVAIGIGAALGIAAVIWLLLLHTR